MRRHSLSLDEAQAAAPDAVWSPRLKQDDAGDRARKELEAKAAAKRAEEQEAATRKAQQVEADGVWELEHRQSRLRDSTATTFTSRSLVFLICFVVGIVLFALVITRDGFSSLSTLQLIIFVVAVVASVINLILGYLWCTNQSWGRSRQLLCCVPCVCDEADDDDYGDDEQDDFYDEGKQP